MLFICRKGGGTMNKGQLTSLTHCINCGNSIETYPSQESVECCICTNIINLKMRNFSEKESEEWSMHLMKISKPTGKKFGD